MGRRMFSGGEGPWEDDTNAEGWWGDEPPFHIPVFVLTQHAREPLVMKGGTTFTFVTEGVESAVEDARAAAAEQDVSIAGGANTIDQTINAGLVDELQIHLAPVLLGNGARLFDGVGPELPRFELIRVLESPLVTHLRYRVVK
jgi:dihydrofolate reductase